MSSRATKRHPREELTVSNGMLKTAAAGLAVAAIALAGCGGGGEHSNTAASSGADVAAAKAAVAEYTGKPTAFPVDQQLKLVRCGHQNDLLSRKHA